MRYPWNLSASLLGAATTIALVQPVAQALTSAEIGNLARAVTVRIETPGASGSGFIIERNGNTYTVLTAQHVLAGLGGNEEAYVIPAADETKSYRLNNRSIRTLPQNLDIDLAIVQFESRDTYQVARLGDSSTVNLGSESYVSGYPLPSAAIDKIALRFTDGIINAVPTETFEKGYGLVYSNNTAAGMSGGPVFNAQGDVIGIHGRGDREGADGSGTKTGFNLAIPINTFRRWNQQNQVVAVNTTTPTFTERAETAEAQASNFFVRGNQQWERGDYRQAISFYEQAIQLNPNYAEAYNNRGAAKRNLGDNQGAIVDYDQAIQLNPNLAGSHYNRGSAKRNLRDYQGAIVDFNQAIQLDPNLALAYTYRGATKTDLGDNRGAIVDYNQAIQLNPNFAYSYYGRGIAKRKLGDNRGAIVDYDQAIQRDPNLVEAYNNRGNAKHNLGNYQGAIVDYNQAIQLNSSLAEAYYGRGNVKSDMEDYQGAIADYDRAIQLNPNFALAYGTRG